MDYERERERQTDRQTDRQKLSKMGSIAVCFLMLAGCHKREQILLILIIHSHRLCSKSVGAGRRLQLAKLKLPAALRKSVFFVHIPDITVQKILEFSYAVVFQVKIILSMTRFNAFTQRSKLEVGFGCTRKGFSAA